jgi:hypothetical protein
VSPINLIDPIEIDRAITAFADSPNGGLIVTGSALTVVRRNLIITLAARYRLPAVYYDRYFVAAGGLISYGSNNVEQFRLAAAYVDRILPVQAPTKYELIINLKTAKGARPHNSREVASHRRRGDRIVVCFAAVAHVRLWHLADITIALRNVRFRG